MALNHDVSLNSSMKPEKRGHRGRATAFPTAAVTSGGFQLGVSVETMDKSIYRDDPVTPQNPPELVGLAPDALAGPLGMFTSHTARHTLP